MFSVCSVKYLIQKTQESEPKIVLADDGIGASKAFSTVPDLITGTNNENSLSLIFAEHTLITMLSLHHFRA